MPADSALRTMVNCQGFYGYESNSLFLCFNRRPEESQIESYLTKPMVIVTC